MKKIIILVLLSILTISCSENNNEIIEKPTFVAIQNPLDFGMISIYDNIGKDLTISNQGNADLTITKMVIENEVIFHLKPFPEEGITIEPGKSHDFTINFFTKKVGTFESTLTFYTNIGEQKVILKGTAIIP